VDYPIRRDDAEYHIVLSIGHQKMFFTVKWCCVLRKLKTLAFVGGENRSMVEVGGFFFQLGSLDHKSKEEAATPKSQ
jgi:hypothetical protein